MDLDDLRVFVDVADGATLQAVAERQHRTVSAVSKALRRLQDALGTRLFDRDGARLRLNDDGRRLLPWARELVERAQMARWAVDPRRGVPRLMLAGPPVLQWRWGGAMAARFRAQAPAGELHFAAMYEDAAVQALLDGRCQAALVTREALQNLPMPEFRVESLGTFRTRLAGAGHAPAGAAPVACTSASPLCGLPRRAQHAALYAELGIDAPTLRVDDVLVLVELVRGGHATAFLPDFLIDAFDLQAMEADVAMPDDEAVVLVCRESHATLLSATNCTA